MNITKILRKLERSKSSNKILGIKALDEYGQKWYSRDLKSFLHGKEKTNIINQIRVLAKKDLEEDEIGNDIEAPTIQQVFY